MPTIFHPSASVKLLQSDLFKPVDGNLPFAHQVDITYRRAREIAKIYALDVNDVLEPSDKFFEMHCDPIHALDIAPLTLLTIHYNLAAGLIAPFLKDRPDLRPLMKRIMKFEISAQFMLTEIGHGLDARHIETTATLLADGSFDLHTPSDAAAKFMPPTGPSSGIPKMAAVFARLVVAGEDRGIRPFLVALNDGTSMCQGVKAIVLPKRTGSKAVGHAITYFDHVRLPSNAILGSLKKPLNDRLNFTKILWRVPVGGVALTMASVASLAVSSTLAVRYSLRRTVVNDSGETVPIWSFRTQQLPILHGLAKAYIMKAHALETARIFRDTTLDYRVRLGVMTAYKAVTIQHSQDSLTAMAERMGAQGLFEHNVIIATQLETRGIGISEGDILALSIRLAGELILGRYEMPPSHYPDSLLAQHESALLAECKAVLKTVGDHRGEQFNQLLLPLSQRLVDAVGCRMAYDAARDLQVVKRLIDLYEAGAMKLDQAWYSENAGLSRWAQHEREAQAANALAAVPVLEGFLKGLHAEPFSATAPIYSADSWSAFAARLDVHEGEAQVELFPSIERPVVEFSPAVFEMARL